MPTKHEILSKNLKRLLPTTHLNQSQLAEICGVSRGSFSDWTAGRAYPRPQKLAILANTLNVTEYDLTTDFESGDLKSYMNREVAGIAAELYDDPEARALYFKITKLSPENRLALKHIIDNLQKNNE